MTQISTIRRTLYVVFALLLLGSGILVLSPAQVASAQGPVSTNSCTTVSETSPMSALFACQLWLQNRMFTLAMSGSITPTTGITPTVPLTPTTGVSGTVPLSTTVPPTVSGNLYTPIHPFGMGECNPLSSGVPYVWKDYVRSEQLVKIFAHDGRGDEGSKICRDVYDWGWRAAWDGFRTYEGAQTYALEEADRVLNSKDANPAFVGKDPVKKIVVYNGNTIVKTIDVR